MVNVWLVSQSLSDIGSLSEDEVKQAMPFCVIACSEISERLKEARFENEPAVIMACAAVALYRYSLSRSMKDDDFSSFKAGDVTISRTASASKENAVKLRDEAMVSAARFLTDVDFMFGTVDV